MKKGPVLVMGAMLLAYGMIGATRADAATPQKQTLRPGALPDDQYYLDAGNVECSRGDYEAAVKSYTNAIAANPRYAIAYYNRGLAFFAQGGVKQSIADFTKAIQLDPKYAAAYYNRGYAYGVKGDLDKAIADYSKSIDINPNAAESYNNRGAAYFMKKDFVKASKDIEKARAMGFQVSPKLLADLAKQK